MLLSLTCRSGVTVTVGFPVVPSELGRSPGSPRAGAGPPARRGPRPSSALPASAEGRRSRSAAGTDVTWRWRP